MKKQVKTEKPAVRSSIGRYLNEPEEHLKPEAQSQEATQAATTHKKPTKKRK
jgi:hypothetical protein